MGDWIIRLIDQSGYLGVGFLMCGSNAAAA